jgi:uncharacterized protein
MEHQDDYRITTMEQLRSLIGEPMALVHKKLLTGLDELAVQFIARSPFLVLATSDAEGHLDASPKGDGPGFVLVEDEHTLVIPDRKGNKLLFGLGNIIARPEVGLIFLIPGTGETLRVNGTAELTVDPVLLERLSARGQRAQLAIRIRVRECFFHCAKALIRSQLWNAKTWPEKLSISWGSYLSTKMDVGDGLAEKIDQAVQEDYKNNL